MKKLSLILATILIFCCLGYSQSGMAFAASETVYTGVLEDLQRDETFDVTAFPAKATLSEDDKVVDVIQIAESNVGELFLYIYQPLANKITVTEVRISTTIGDELSVQDYKLTLLQRVGTLEKYKVNALQVKSEAERYYLIIQLSRPWNAQIDNGNVVDSIAYGIEKLFTAVNSANSVDYSEEHADCLEVVSKYVGNLRYYDGGTWGQEYYTSVHYVAFSTEILINKIYAVDVKYTVTGYSSVDDYAYKHWSDENFSKTFYYDPNKKPFVVQKTLTSKEYFSYKNVWDYLLDKKHTWETIQSKDKFVAMENLDPAVREKLNDKQWVLRFDTTNITIREMGLFGQTYSFSEVSDVTLLKLNFLSNGRVYNLGVIDNKQTGGSVTSPDNPTDNPGPVESFNELLKRMEAFWNKVENAFNWLLEHWWVILVGIAAIAVVIGLLIACAKLSAKVVFKAIGFVLWWVLKIIFYIVTCPFWIIWLIVRAAKKNKH